MKWIRTKQLAEKLALSTTGLKVLIEREPEFPKAVQVSERHVVFDEEAVEDWMRKKLFMGTQEASDEQSYRDA